MVAMGTAAVTVETVAMAIVAMTEVAMATVAMVVVVEAVVDAARGKFDCGNGYCIAKRKKCDGVNDCNNWKDEKNCGDCST